MLSFFAHRCGIVQVTSLGMHVLSSTMVLLYTCNWRVQRCVENGNQQFSLGCVLGSTTISAADHLSYSDFASVSRSTVSVAPRGMS